jgi:hypothetical protein
MSSLAFLTAIALANLLLARFFAFSVTSAIWTALAIAALAVAWSLGRAARSLRVRSGGADKAMEEGLGILTDFSEDRVGVIWSEKEETIRRVMLTLLALTASGAAVAASVAFLSEDWMRFAVIFVTASCAEWLLYYWLPSVNRYVGSFTGWTSDMPSADRSG